MQTLDSLSICLSSRERDREKDEGEGVVVLDTGMFSIKVRTPRRPQTTPRDTHTLHC